MVLQERILIKSVLDKNRVYLLNQVYQHKSLIKLDKDETTFSLSDRPWPK